MEPTNALATEYQRDYSGAHRNVDVAHFVNNPSANGVCRVFSHFLKEELVDGGLVKMGALLDDKPVIPLPTMTEIVERYAPRVDQRTPPDTGGSTVIPILLPGRGQAGALKVPTAMTEAEWQAMMAIITAYKPTIVRATPTSESDPTA